MAEKSLFAIGLGLILRMRMSVTKLRRWQKSVEKEEGKAEKAIEKGEADAIMKDFTAEMAAMKHEMDTLEHLYHLEDVWANKDVKADFVHEKNEIEELGKAGFPTDKLEEMKKEFNETVAKFREVLTSIENELERINNTMREIKAA
jgi:hypothetical protein